MPPPVSSDQASGPQTRTDPTASSGSWNSFAVAPGSARSSDEGDRQHTHPPQSTMNGVSPAQGSSVAIGAQFTQGAAPGDWPPRSAQTNAGTAALNLSLPGEGMGGEISAMYTLATGSREAVPTRNDYTGQVNGVYGGSPDFQCFPPHPPDDRTRLLASQSRGSTTQPLQGYEYAPAQGYSNAMSSQYNAPPSQFSQQPNPSDRYVRDREDDTPQYMNNGGDRRRRRRRS